MPVEVGTLLRGRYRIDAALSAHAHGGVYRAYDLEADGLCMVKEHLSVTQAEFVAAARALLPLIHPNLADVIDHFSLDEGHHYLVLEYVRGESLTDRVARFGPLPEEEALMHMSQVLVALDYLHTRTSNLLHCDVNPSNIFITKDDLTVLVGYSIGGTVSSSTTATLVAPEHVAGTPEVASEVYAAGATLYFVLTGKIPGGHEGGWTDRFAIEPLSKVSTRVSRELIKVIEKSMQFRADYRYENIRELRKAIGRAAVRSRTWETEKLDDLDRAQGSSLAWGLSIITAAMIAGIGLLAFFNWDTLLIPPTQSPSTIVVIAGFQEPTATIRLPSPSGLPSATILPSSTPLPKATVHLVPSETLSPVNTLPHTPTLPPTATIRLPTNTPRPIATLGIGSTAIAAADGVTLVYVPEGEFLVGSHWSDPLAVEGERPQQLIYLPAFWIDQTEVTNAQYRKCVTVGLCSEPSRLSSATRKRYFRNSKYDEYPVIWVDWSQARDYCEWAGRRLPTDVEWEKAARGTDGRWYPWGDEPVDAMLVTGKARANFGTIMRDTTMVGTYQTGASPYGVLDMSGNVAEWVSDFYRSHYYQYAQWLTATLESEWRFRGGQHGVRNGSWNGSLVSIRAAHRGFSARDDYASHDLGFRCASTGNP